MSLKLIAGPASEPISLAEAKADLRILHDHEDDVIQGLIREARAFCERVTGRALLPQTWRKTYDNFPAALELGVLPVISVQSVQYLDPDGALQTLSSNGYLLDNASDDRPAWLVTAPGYAWPLTWKSVNGVRVEFIAVIQMPIMFRQIYGAGCYCRSATGTKTERPSCQAT